MMDATTSRVFLKAITNTRALGRVVVFIDGDFRGGRENSYVPRLRLGLRVDARLHAWAAT